MTFKPWDHQAAAIEAMLTAPDRSLCVIPTGGGKSAVMGSLAARRKGRVLILAHVKDLVRQNAKACAMFSPLSEIGQCAAAFGRYDTFRRITVAMAQTLVNRMDRVTAWDQIYVDEAHRIPHGDEGQFHAIFRRARELNQNVRIDGLTATPYRYPRGMLTDGEDRLFENIAYEVGIGDLTAQGILTPIHARSGLKANMDLTGVKVVAGEYQTKGLGKAAMRSLPQAVASIIANAAGRKSILIFASSVEHAQALAAMITLHTGERVEIAHSGSLDRDGALSRFASRQSRWAVNMGMWTTGVDVPAIDMIVLARATKSRNLFEQMIGRGTRLFPDKTGCLLLDLGGNVEEFGGVGITDIESKGPSQGGEAPVIICRDDNSLTGIGCGEYSPAGAVVCRGCGMPFLSQTSLRVSSFEGEQDLSLAHTRGDWVLIRAAKVGRAKQQPKLTIQWEGGSAARIAYRSERTPEAAAALVGKWALVKGDVLHGIASTRP